MNNDGLPDVVAHNTLYLANPAGEYYPAQPIWIGSAGADQVADFNDDGKADLAGRVEHPAPAVKHGGALPEVEVENLS